MVLDFRNKKEFENEARKLAKRKKIPIKHAKYLVWYSNHNKINEKNLRMLR